MFYFILAAYVLSTTAGLVLIKLGSVGAPLVSIEAGRFAIHPTWFNMSGLMLYGISFLLYTYLISKNDLGYIIPVTTALVYVLIFIASFFIFKEPFSAQKMIAIGLIISGVILLNTK